MGPPSSWLEGGVGFLHPHQLQSWRDRWGRALPGQASSHNYETTVPGHDLSALGCPAISVEGCASSSMSAQGHTGPADGAAVSPGVLVRPAHCSELCHRPWRPHSHNLPRRQQPWACLCHSLVLPPPCGPPLWGRAGVWALSGEFRDLLREHHIWVLRRKSELLQQTKGKGWSR